MSNGEFIVIIDDDEDDRDVLRDVFQSLAIRKELVFFESSNEAYNFLMSTTAKPFLIICDINLPRMNGIELKRKIDTTDYLRRKAIPFVFLTTADRDYTIDEAYSATNLQGYFRKGVAMEEIKHTVQCIISYWSAALHPTI
jgi:CheY-like chemotaxis protein